MGPNVGDFRFDSLVNSYQVWNGYEWVITDRNTVQAGAHYYSDNTSGLRVGNPNPTNIFQVITSSGESIKANMETGSVEFPERMNITTALYEFWQGFSRIYKVNNSEVSLAKQETAFLRQRVKDTHIDAKKNIAEKIQKKYGNEKFIMLKPDDLINFIKGD